MAETEKEARLKYGEPHLCNCVGPQGGQPLCPCQMRGVTVRDGRYIAPERDLGPVVPGSESFKFEDYLKTQGPVK